MSQHINYISEKDYYMYYSAVGTVTVAFHILCIMQTSTNWMTLHYSA